MQECYVYFVDLNEKQQKQLIVLDNRTSQLSEINNNAIQKMLYDLNKNKLLTVTDLSPISLYIAGRAKFKNLNELGKS